MTRENSETELSISFSCVLQVDTSFAHLRLTLAEKSVVQSSKTEVVTNASGKSHFHQRLLTGAEQMMYRLEGRKKRIDSFVSEFSLAQRYGNAR